MGLSDNMPDFIYCNPDGTWTSFDNSEIKYDQSIKYVKVTSEQKSSSDQMVTIEHEACPKCQSIDVKSYWWYRGQAWIIICQNCEHEVGRESEEHKAWKKWDKEAQKIKEEKDGTF